MFHGLKINPSNGPQRNTSPANVRWILGVRRDNNWWMRAAFTLKMALGGETQHQHHWPKTSKKNAQKTFKKWWSRCRSFFVQISWHRCRLDTSKSMAFRNLDRYCVAPIVFGQEIALKPLVSSKVCWTEKCVVNCLDAKFCVLLETLMMYPIGVSTSSMKDPPFKAVAHCSCHFVEDLDIDRMWLRMSEISGHCDEDPLEMS